MDTSEFLAGLSDAGEKLAKAAESAGLDAAVPSCPDWTVRDLLFHIGAVHRWAARSVREALTEPPKEAVGGDPLRDADQRPADAELIGWFRDGHAALVEALQNAPADLVCWTFLPAPSPRLFWARRQLHETTMHRVDAELAAGAVTPIDPAVATNGIDELLTGFVVRRGGKLRADTPRALGVHTTDTGAHWTLTISQEPVATARSDDDADAAISGPASEVYRVLWNRLPLDALATSGDAELLAQWPDLVRVRWSR